MKKRPVPIHETGYICASLATVSAELISGPEPFHWLYRQYTMPAPAHFSIKYFFSSLFLFYFGRYLFNKWGMPFIRSASASLETHVKTFHRMRQCTYRNVIHSTFCIVTQGVEGNTTR